jgi:predicted  nucleic acid-binding Zn-ribbon protein
MPFLRILFTLWVLSALAPAQIHVDSSPDMMNDVANTDSDSDEVVDAAENPITPQTQIVVKADFEVENHFGSDVVASLYCSDQHGGPVGSPVATSTISSYGNYTVPIGTLMIGKKYVLRVKEAGQPDEKYVSACCLTRPKSE